MVALGKQVGLLLARAGQLELVFDYLNTPEIVKVYQKVSKDMLQIL